jgi:hypothetical protein
MSVLFFPTAERHRRPEMARPIDRATAGFLFVFNTFGLSCTFTKLKAIFQCAKMMVFSTELQNGVADWK